MEYNPEIAFAHPELARPPPYLAEQSAGADPLRISRSADHDAVERPSCARAMFSCSLRSARADRRYALDQLAHFLRRQRCGIVRLLEKVVHALIPEQRGFVSRTISSRRASASLAVTFWSSSNIECSTGPRRRRANARARSRSVVSSGSLARAHRQACSRAPRLRVVMSPARWCPLLPTVRAPRGRLPDSQPLRELRG